MKHKKNFIAYSKELISFIDASYKKLLSGVNEEELLHDLRVSLRKINTIIEFLIYIEKKEKTKKQLLKYLFIYKKLFKSLSASRDNEVQIELAYKLAGEFSKEYQKEFMTYIKSLKKTFTINTSEIVNSKKISNINENLLLILSNSYLKRKTIEKKIDDFEKLLIKKNRKSISKLEKDSEYFHKTRIQIKKYRYFLEFKSNIFNTKNSKGTLLKNIQDRFGYCNDLSILYSNISLFASNGLLHRIDDSKKSELLYAINFLEKNKRKLLEIQ